MARVDDSLVADANGLATNAKIPDVIIIAKNAREKYVDLIFFVLCSDSLQGR